MTHLMNPITGSVATKKEWESEMEDWCAEHDSLEYQFASLIEVKYDDQMETWTEI